jgi:AbrB family looped-hinge helix DNA binding protein
VHGAGGLADLGHLGEGEPDELGDLVLLGWAIRGLDRPHQYIVAAGADAPSRAVSLLASASKETVPEMDARARITSKGQVTIPKSVREALELHEGDELLFRVERSRALVAKTPDFLGLAGSVSVPAAKRGTPWDEVLRQTRSDRAGRRR